VDQSIKQYLRRIGSKGGKALAGNPQAKVKAAAKAIAGTPKAKARAAKAAKGTMGQTKTEKRKPKMRLTKELLKSGPGKIPNLRKRRKDDVFFYFIGFAPRWIAFSGWRPRRHLT